jgi:hypothetical protein
MTAKLTRTHAIFAGVLVAVLALGIWALSRDTRNPEWLRDKYGVSDAFTQEVDTPDGTVTASLVPVNLTDGRTAYLVIPQRGGDRLYLKDDNGVAPVETTDQVIDKDRFVRSRPVIIEKPVTTTRVAPEKRRSTRDEVLIVAGGAGAGAAVGGVAGGKKGAAVGAISGGVAGLVYDLATRNK